MSTDNEQVGLNLQNSFSGTVIFGVLLSTDITFLRGGVNCIFHFWNPAFSSYYYVREGAAVVM